MAHVRHAIACASRYGNDITEIQVVLHERIKHTGGENATHSATFQHQSSIPVYLHHSIFIAKIIFFLLSTK
jgi:hypothetical protein